MSEQINTEPLQLRVITCLEEIHVHSGFGQYTKSKTGSNIMQHSPPYCHKTEICFYQ